MNKNQLSGLVRGMMILCAAALAMVLFVPLWRIDLDAPQYPEGLMLLIYPNKLGGNVDIVNGLNHYIGMKTLHAEDFLEFTVLPYIIGFFAVLALLVGISAKPKLLYTFLGLFICFGIISMVDFWRWEYNYGHNLDPNAAIVVPGMSYQPPLIGFKQLLNFGAYSMPDVGGYLFIAVGLLSMVAVWMTRKQQLKLKSGSIPVMGVLTAILLLSSSCNTGPEAIKVGKDNCYFCKMTITDPRFASEIVTKKGRAYKFDDSHCLLAYLKTNDVPAEQIKDIYVANFSGNNELLNVTEAMFLQSEALRGPMGGSLAAFNHADSFKQAQQQFSAVVVEWKEISK
ncbi:MAG: nitrous oxide reductase accessory protein NosL [Sediminibacterium sp.]|jgi:copper chaperone NosL|nr:nitrous oxide reductase accessory protein NosL [Sediminibacterium sp.]